MRILGKLIPGLLGLSLVGVAAVVLVNAFDESPSPLLQNAASQSRWSRPYEESNGYFYLLGFAAPAGSDPARAAQKVVERYNANIDADHRQLSLSDLMQDIEGLALNGDEAVLCDWQDADCLAHFEQHAASFDALVSDNALLLERYHALIRHPDYRTAIKPSYLEPYTAVPALLRYAQQLMFYRVFTSSPGQPDADAIDLDIAFWRRVLAHTDIMPDKALAAHLVRNNAAFRHALDVRYDAAYTAALGPLSPAEADPEPVLRRELHGALWAVEQFDRFGVATTPRWVNSPPGRYFLKPTATKNLLASYYDRLIAIIDDDPQTWRASLDNLERLFDGKTGGLRRLYNPVGKTYFLADAETQANFAARLINLKGYLSLIRIAGQLSPAMENDLHNCTQLSFDPLRFDVPSCSRLIDDPAQGLDVRLEALSARARAYAAAITYRADHDVTTEELRAAALADWNEAVALVRESGKRERLAPFLRERGDARWMTADYEGAIADYNAFLIEREEVSSVLGSRAMMFEQLGRYDEAIQDMTAAIRLVGPAYCSNLHNWVLQRGEMYEAAGDLAAAERDYRTTLGADPEHNAARAALERIGVAPGQVSGVDDLPVPPTCDR